MTGPEVLVGTGGMPRDPAAARLRASFAERHVPLPRPLAEALARLLVARQPLSEPVWGRAFARMAQALGVSGSVAGQQILKGVLDRFVVVVAEPVMRGAAKRAGVLPLAGAGDFHGGGADWDLAEAKVARAAEAALADVAVMGAPFWAHVALDLAGAAQRKARARARLSADAAAPECDPLLAALVFLHPPRFDGGLRMERVRRKARQVSALRRAGIRPKEGGVAGILQSRQFDDLPDALMSELILPREVLANKLLQEGLLVRHRPPRRDPKRDLLALTLHRALLGDAMGTLVKAAWADAAIRLRLALFQMGLVHSDLLWSEPGAAQALNCALDLPGLDRFPPLMIEGKVRADMLMHSGLYPAHSALPTPPGKSRAADGTEQTAEAEPGREPMGTGADLVSQTRAAMMQVAAGNGRSRAAASVAQDYGRRFVLVSQPHRGRHAPDWIAIRAEHAAVLGRDIGRAHMACLTWARGNGRQPPPLLALADGREPLELTVPAPDAPDRDEALAGFLGELVLWMMDVTLEALDVAQA